ncbi:WAS/WASL-interacting protein family member 3-like [Myxocyprinus asiaticus]|uniref:WAS/WASL-interacting protein family member 3-like n=1 Tax=Myxocyprinus asiaticus TaxID=70543 RepID=UPI002222D528|nr:WAS/WASL-interacting protein family member 3-like [Myxocyprinus asiaticus]
MDLAAVRILLHKQGDRPFEDHVCEFLELANLVHYPDCSLVVFFRTSLNGALKELMPPADPHWTLCEYVEKALERCGCRYTVDYGGNPGPKLASTAPPAPPESLPVAPPAPPPASPPTDPVPALWLPPVPTLWPPPRPPDPVPALRRPPPDLRTQSLPWGLLPGHLVIFWVSFLTCIFLPSSAIFGAPGVTP